jgi:hypothetical protein
MKWARGWTDIHSPEINHQSVVKEGGSKALVRSNFKSPTKYHGHPVSQVAAAFRVVNVAFS